MSLVEIHKIEFTDKPVRIVFPSLNDIKLVIYDNEELFDLLIQNKIKISSVKVATDSKMYKTAIKNSVVIPVK